ncbi:MAG: reverse transcriptase/maturase family protein [Elusimicrobia bacterium]|nr:reverse transcriptase/maturase family protein [Elusimicrobiota bacterium]
MRTYKNLYEQLCSFKNLYQAFRQAAKGKRLRSYCAEFSYNREQNIFAIRDELLSGVYRHGSYREFEVADPKRRQVKAAEFRDRVVHHALCNVIEPIFEARFIFDNFACRKGKGTLLALGRCKKFVKRFKCDYVLKADISKYFYSVDHAILLKIIGRKIADERVMSLIREILSSSQDSRFRDYFPNDDLFALQRPTGIPIGNLTSQLFANIYLNELDYFVKHELKHKYYLRYMDDFLLFSTDKKELFVALKRIEVFLAENLRLRAHPVKRIISPVKCGVDWVGYKVYPWTVRIRRMNIFRFRKRNRYLRNLYHHKKISARKIGDSIASFCGYSRWADAGRLIKQLLEIEIF